MASSQVCLTVKSGPVSLSQIKPQSNHPSDLQLMGDNALVAPWDVRLQNNLGLASRRKPMCAILNDMRTFRSRHMGAFPVMGST